MEQRSQPRVEISEPVEIAVLGEREMKLPGRIANYSSHGMGLRVDRAVPIGAAVKVQWSNVLLLGEVCRCHADGEGFTIGLLLEHALYDTLALAELARRLLDEAPAAEGVEARKR